MGLSAISPVRAIPAKTKPVFHQDEIPEKREKNRDRHIGKCADPENYFCHGFFYHGRLATVVPACPLCDLLSGGVAAGILRLAAVKVLRANLRVLEWLAERVIEEDGITKEQLLVDVDAVLAAKDFAVSERELPENLAAVLDTCVDGKPILPVDKNQTAERKRFVKVSELGHFLLDADFKDVRTDKKSPLVGVLGAHSDKNFLLCK